MQPYHVVSVVFVVLSLPLILKRAPPNPIYGFRTRKTMSDEPAFSI